MILFSLQKSVLDSQVTKQIHQEFGELFAMKVLIFVQELLSVVLTPFVLWFSLPNCAPTIIDFFREFSVHVEGRGYVCSFAEFNFERHGNVKVSSQINTWSRILIGSSQIVWCTDPNPGSEDVVKRRQNGKKLFKLQGKLLILLCIITQLLRRNNIGRKS